MNDIDQVVRRIKQNLLSYNAGSLVDAILLSIRNGKFSAGTRLPTIATMAKALELSPSTVSKAWATLVEMGMIETSRRGGTRIASPVEATAYRYKGLEQQKFKHFLSPGYPDQDLQIDLGALLHRVALQGSFPGYPGKDQISDSLRSAILLRLGYEPESMILDTDLIGVLPRILQVVGHRGATIGIGDPDFPLYKTILKQNGMNPFPIKFSEAGYNIADLESALRNGARTVLLQTRVQNPTGLIVPTENLEKISSILHKYDATAIEIDHHGALVPESHTRLASFAPERTILLTSFSKDIHPDLRVSVISGSRPLIDRISIWRAGGYWVSSINRQLLEECLTDPTVEQVITNARLEYARRREVFRQALSHRGIEVQSNAGLNFWVPVVSEQETLLHLASQSISVAPGSAFSNASDAHPHIHLSLGAVGAHATLLSSAIAEAAIALPQEPGFY